MKRLGWLSFALGAIAGIVVTTALPLGYAQQGVAPQAPRETGAPRSAKEGRGPTPYLAVQNEPPPKLFVDDPFARGAAHRRYLDPVPNRKLPDPPRIR